MWILIGVRIDVRLVGGKGVEQGQGAGGVGVYNTAMAQPAVHGVVVWRGSTELQRVRVSNLSSI